MKKSVDESPPNVPNTEEKNREPRYRISMTKFAISGVAASISGAGVWVRVGARFPMPGKALESSPTYVLLRREYGFGCGVKAFWHWLTSENYAKDHKAELTKIFDEIRASKTPSGIINASFSVSGIYPNIEASVHVFVYILEVKDRRERVIRVSTSEDPKNDVGGQDQEGNELPVSDNKSKIEM